MSAMWSASAPPLPDIVGQHVEEAAHLSHMRSALTRAPHPRLHALHRLDDRLAAHLDGIAVAGDEGWAACEEILDGGSAGAVFTCAVRAIEDGHEARIDRMLSLAQALPAARAELASALGWVSANWLQGLTAQLFASSGAVRQSLAIVACVTHRVDPGTGLTSALSDADTALRACALRAAGDCGRQDLRQACVDAARRDDDPMIRFWAARAAVLLGERRVGLDVLHNLALEAGPHRRGALHLLLKVLPPGDAASVLRQLAAAPAADRDLLSGAGVTGDPNFVPWLIERMREPDAARLAGESFALLTGCDLSSAAFMKVPEEGDEGEDTEEDAAAPNAIEEDPLSLDEDGDLPMPDAVKTLTWWTENAQRFAAGTRYFLGAPLDAPHCRMVLRSGYQRQRIAAAEYLSLLQPGTPVFNTAAPSWRQQRWLAAMSA